MLFSIDWTISSSVLDGTRCRLTVVSLVSEPSLYLHKAWLLIGISFDLAFQQFKCFLTTYPYVVGPTLKPLSIQTQNKKFIHACYLKHSCWGCWIASVHHSILRKQRKQELPHILHTHTSCNIFLHHACCPSYWKVR